MKNKTGVLWNDDASNESNGKIKGKSEKEKIIQAIAYCEKKYKCKITYVEISRSSNFPDKDAIEGVVVRRVGNIPPNNYWLMIPDESLKLDK